MPKKAILSGLAGVMLLLVGVLLAAALTPIPVPLSPERVSAFLRQHYFTYDVGFSRARLHWQPQDRTVSLHLDDVELREPGRERVATVPGIVVTVGTGALFSRPNGLRSVTLSGATISVIKTAGGALKVDLGPSREGLSGSLVMTLLTDIAASQGRPGSGAAPPALRVAGSVLHLRDETTGVRLTLEPWDAEIRSATDGVHTSTRFRTEAAGEQIDADLDIAFGTSGYGFSVRGAFGNLTPAVLSRRFPNLAFLAPFEIALAGEIDARLDRFLAIEHAEIALRGHTGSLEMAQFLGRNLKITDLEAGLVIDNAGEAFRVHDLIFFMDGASMRGNVTGQATAEMLQLDADLILSAASWSDIAPLWFASLAPMIAGESGDGNDPSALPAQRLVFSVAADHASGQIDGTGEMRLVSDDASEKIIALALSGSLGFPELRFHLRP